MDGSSSKDDEILATLDKIWSAVQTLGFVADNMSTNMDGVGQLLQNLDKQVGEISTRLNANDQNVNTISTSLGLVSASIADMNSLERDRYENVSTSLSNIKEKLTSYEEFMRDSFSKNEGSFQECFATLKKDISDLFHDMLERVSEIFDETASSRTTAEACLSAIVKLQGQISSSITDWVEAATDGATIVASANTSFDEMRETVDELQSIQAELNQLNELVTKAIGVASSVSYVGLSIEERLISKNKLDVANESVQSLTSLIDSVCNVVRTTRRQSGL